VPVTLAVKWTVFQRESKPDNNENTKRELQIRLHCKGKDVVRKTVYGERKQRGCPAFWPTDHKTGTSYQDLQNKVYRVMLNADSCNKLHIFSIYLEAFFLLNYLPST